MIISLDTRRVGSTQIKGGIGQPDRELLDCTDRSRNGYYWDGGRELHRLGRNWEADMDRCTKTSEYLAPRDRQFAISTELKLNDDLSIRSNELLLCSVPQSFLSSSLTLTGMSTLPTFSSPSLILPASNLSLASTYSSIHFRCHGHFALYSIGRWSKRLSSQL